MAVILSRQTNGNLLNITTASDPSVSGGTVAPKGSVCRTQDGKEFIKYGDLPTEWRDISDETFDVVTLTEQTTPVAPSTGLKFYSKNSAQRQMLAQIGKSGIDYPFQASLAMNAVALVRPNGNSTTATTIGLVAGTNGTATARAVATTNFYTALRRIAYVSSAAQGNNCSIFGSSAQYYRGAAVKAGGFYSVFRFGISDAAAVAQGRIFVGMSAAVAAHGNANPTALLNVLGVGADSTDTTLKLMYNDGSGVATEVELGSGFAANTRNTDAFELVIFAPKNSSDVHFQITNLTTGFTFYHTANSNIPAATQLLSWQFWRNNGTTGAAVGLDLIGLYIETDN